MSSPPLLLPLLLLLPLTWSQYYSSYPNYRNQLSAFAPQSTFPSSPSFPSSSSSFPSSPTFSPYTNYPPVSYVVPRFSPSYSYFRPTFSFPSYSRPSSSYSPASPRSSPSLPPPPRPSRSPFLPSRQQEVTPAWQGKVNGRGVTRCHDGALLPFRARCNKEPECSQGEDEADCDWHKRSSVTTVTSVREFEKVLRENDNVLVDFFAPWCPACVRFQPHLDRLSAATQDIPLMVIKVNIDEDPELKELFSVDTFPRVMLWSKRWGEGVSTYMYSQHRTYSKEWGLNFRSVHAWIRQQFWLQA